MATSDACRLTARLDQRICQQSTRDALTEIHSRCQTTEHRTLLIEFFIHFSPTCLHVFKCFNGVSSNEHIGNTWFESYIINEYLTIDSSGWQVKE